ncbi:GD15515 [Drosophila simulans]|uniref:GD15515 n=1 Tax=Drosophila simulans TaxID=7240 RepID=B4R3C6_DROSI|nr:GD15515 [Drosophila simulans]
MSAISGRALHYVFKIGDRAKNAFFFRQILGMTVLRHEEFKEGCDAACNGPYDNRWSKTMVGYGPESSHFVIELTYNYGVSSYELEQSPFALEMEKRRLFACIGAGRFKHILDFAISGGLDPARIQTREVEDLLSDHSAIAVSVYASAMLRSAGKKLIFKTSDISKYHHWLNNSTVTNPPLDTPELIDAAVVNLTSQIQEAATYAAPRFSNQTRDRSRDVHFWNPRVNELKSEKRRLRRVWFLSRNPRDKTALNRATKELKETLVRLRKEALDSFVGNLAPGDPHHNLWNVTKRIKRPLKRIPPIRRQDNSWCRTETERANAFAEHLEEVFTPANRCSPNEAAETARLLSEPLFDSESIPQATEEEISNLIAAMASH